MPDRRFACENCGNQLVFAPGQTALACPYCGHVQEIGQEPDEDAGEALEERDYSEMIRELERAAPHEEARALACPNCGAQTEFPPNTEAARCPFCATPLLAETTHRHIRPAALIPFQIDERRAREAMAAWLGSLWLAPSGLRQYARAGRRMDGVYVPYWTFDADTATAYRGQRGDAYVTSRTVMRGGKPTRVSETRIRWRGVRGRVSRAFDDVLVLASRSLTRTHTDALEPWALDALAPFRPDYLAGFAAEGYGIGLAEGFAEARAKMDAVIEEDIRRDIGGDRQRIAARSTDIRDVTFKHVLLPVWMAAYRYGGRTFRFVVNGQTGKVRGERPWSRWKVALAVALGLILAAAALYVYALGQDGGSISRDGGPVVGPGPAVDAGPAPFDPDAPSWLQEE